MSYSVYIKYRSKRYKLPVNPEGNQEETEAEY